MGTVEVALYPQKLWQTSPKEELDYSLVACQVPQGIQVCRMPYAVARRRTNEYAKGTSMQTYSRDTKHTGVCKDTKCEGRYEAVVLVRSELSVVEAGDTVMIVQHPDGSEKSLSSGPIHKVLHQN